MEELQILLEESIMIRFVTNIWLFIRFFKESEVIDFLSTLTYIVHIFILAKTIHLHTFRKNKN